MNFKELSDAVCEYENTEFADAAITAFENWATPMKDWPTIKEIPLEHYDVCLEIIALCKDCYEQV